MKCPKCNNRMQLKVSTSKDEWACNCGYSTPFEVSERKVDAVVDATNKYLRLKGFATRAYFGEVACILKGRMLVKDSIPDFEEM